MLQLRGLVNVTSISITLISGTIIAIAYVCVYVAYLSVVVGSLDVLHGYYRRDLLPGPLIDDRYSWGWCFLLISTMRGFIPFLYLNTLVGLKEPYKRLWFERIARWFIPIDIVLMIFFLITICFVCNSTYSAQSLCNESLDRWCMAYGIDHQDRCMPWPSGYVPLEPCDLSPNPAFIRWIYFTIAFFIFDMMLIYLTLDMNIYVDRFLMYQ